MRVSEIPSAAARDRRCWRSVLCATNRHASLTSSMLGPFVGCNSIRMKITKQSKHRYHFLYSVGFTLTAMRSSSNYSFVGVSVTLTQRGR